jgi:mannose-6-phosphate isomerase-like protein (cupin superfamily)
MNTIDLGAVFLALSRDGRADPLEGAHFGERLGRAPADMAYLVGIHPLTSDWPHWEMHPKGCEILVLLEGRLEMSLDDGETVKVTPFLPGQTLVVPPGVWHRARVLETGRMLGITYGEGTTHRPA